MPLVRISTIVAAVDLNLVSCGLYSWICLLIFPYGSAVLVDTNSKLYDIVWHRYRIEPRMASFLLFNNSSTVSMLHFPLFFSLSLIKTTSPTSIFNYFVLCIILCLSRRDRKYSFSIFSMLPL